MALNPQRIATELETLAGLGRGKKAEQAVRFKDLTGTEFQRAVQATAPGGASRDELDTINERVQDALDQANEAAQAAQDADDNATAAHQFADDLVNSVTGELYEIMEAGFALSSEAEGRERTVINDTFLVSSDWTRFNGEGTLVQTENAVYPIGRTWDFLVSAEQLDGMQIIDSPDTIWTGQKNAPGYVIEVVWSLDGGTWNGAGIRLTWRNSGGTEFAVNRTLQSMEQGANTPGRARVSRAVLVKPAGFTGTFASHRLFAFANWNGPGWTMGNKRIRFHRVSLRLASPSEISTGQVATGSQAWLNQHFMTAANVDAAIANFDMNLHAELGTGWASVKQSQTAIASINGNVARFRNMVTVDGVNFAGIESVAFDGTGMGTGTVTKLYGDQVIIPGTLSAREVVVHDGSSNMFPDPTFILRSLSAWTVIGPPGVFSAISKSAIPGEGVRNAAPAGTVLMIANHNGLGSATLRSAPFAIEPGTVWNLAMSYAVAASQIHPVVYRLRFYDADGVSIGINGISENGGLSTWSTFSTDVTAPPGAVTAAIEIVSNDTGTMQNYACATNFSLIRKRTGATLITPNSVTTALLNTVDFQAAGLAIFGGAVQSDNFNAGAGTGWRITQAGQLTVPDASITNAKIGNVIQSNNFVTGPSGTGWQINKNGNAEFNSVTIRRQLQIASGTLSVPGFMPFDTGAGEDIGTNNYWATESNQLFVTSTPIAITAWLGVEKTYLVNVGMTGGVDAKPGTVPDVYWGWTAEVVPMTRWSGNQSLRLRFKFWSRNVHYVHASTLTWKIYEVS